MSTAQVPLDPAGKPTWKEAAVHSAASSMLFIGVYGITNYLASLQHYIGSLHFPAELSMPLVPIMIVPYMSIDLFFAASFFLCTERRELKVLTRRITLAIFVAAFFFVFFPQKVVFTRSPVAGFWGPAYAFLYSFDMPYNLAPSLHIAFRSILWFVYTRHTRGALNLALRIWFILIGVSTILTHQHHLIDIATGQVLALFCFYMLPDPRLSFWSVPRRMHNRTLAQRYAAGAISLAIAGVVFRPWGWLLFWPAFSLAMLAMGYGSLGAGIFRKQQGRIPLSTRIWLGPYLLGAWVSRPWLGQRAAADAQVAPGVHFGRLLGGGDVEGLSRRGIASVLDMTAECSADPRVRKMNYLNLAVLDLTPPSPEQLRIACEFVDRHAAGGVYVNCALGLGRSACVVAAYLLHSGRAASIDEALEQIRRVRPQVVVRDDAVEALRQFAALAAANRAGVQRG